MLLRTLLFATALTVGVSTSASLAETETTTTTTTTQVTATVPAVTLTGSGSYIVVNPTTGSELGLYDPVTRRLLNGATVIPGSYIIEKDSGKVLATLDSSGNLVAFSVVPGVAPTRFTLVNNQLVYIAAGYAFRRAQLEQQIDEQFAAGHLSSHQVRELRGTLAEISALETRCRPDGTYKSGTAKDIERKFAYVQEKLANDIADINSKRAKIGIRVD